MGYLFSVRRRYTTLLPPSAVRRRLENSIKQPPKGGWRSFFWQLSPFHPRCWGEIQPVENTFWARLPMNRSDGPVVHGFWQATADTEGLELLTGTSVQLVIRLSLGDRLFGFFLLGLLLPTCLLGGVFAEPAQAPLVPLGLLFLFTAVFVLTRRRSIRSAERYFQQALGLRRQAK